MNVASFCWLVMNVHRHCSFPCSCVFTVLVCDPTEDEDHCCCRRCFSLCSPIRRRRASNRTIKRTPNKRRAPSPIHLKMTNILAHIQRIQIIRAHSIGLRHSHALLSFRCGQHCVRAVWMQSIRYIRALHWQWWTHALFAPIVLFVQAISSINNHRNTHHPKYFYAMPVIFHYSPPPAPPPLPFDNEWSPCVHIANAESNPNGSARFSPRLLASN